jgi:hypothetical protein
MDIITTTSCTPRMRRCGGNRTRLPARLPQRRARPEVHPPAVRGRLARMQRMGQHRRLRKARAGRQLAFRHQLALAHPDGDPGHGCIAQQTECDLSGQRRVTGRRSLRRRRFDRSHQFGQVPLQTLPLFARRRDTAGEHHQHADQPGEEQDDDGRTPRDTDADRTQRSVCANGSLHRDGGSVITTRPGSTAPTGGYARAAARMTESSPLLASCSGHRCQD